MKTTSFTLERTAAKAHELARLLAQTNGEREITETALLSGMAAIERVRPAARTELQSLVADFTANPDDKAAVRRLGALLRDARVPAH